MKSWSVSLKLQSSQAQLKDDDKSRRGPNTLRSQVLQSGTGRVPRVPYGGCGDESTWTVRQLSSWSCLTTTRRRLTDARATDRVKSSALDVGVACSKRRPAICDGDDNRPCAARVVRPLISVRGRWSTDRPTTPGPGRAGPGALPP